MNFDLWTTHSLDKIFPESLKPGGAAESIHLKAARNETEDAQIALRIPRGLEISEATFRLPDLVGANGAAISRKHLSASWIWCLYVLNNPPENRDPASYLRKAPAFFPDAFLEEKAIAIRDEWTQPLWVSVSVPKGTPPGDYAGVLTIDLTSKDGEKHRSEVPIELAVWPFTLPDEFHLHHTEWFWEMPLANAYHLEPWSEEHWRWIAKVAADMVRHKQDMILTPFTSLVTITRSASARFRYDFSKLDRWVKTFRKAGITWIEGAHVAGRIGGWEGDFGWRRFPVSGPDGKPLDTSREKLSDPEFEPFVEHFLKAIYAHLKAAGWGARCVQHVADEPLPANEASWSHCARKVRQWLPGVPTIDAVMSGGLEGLVDWRVPQIQELGPNTPRSPGEDLWSYVCLAPQGHYPNRFLDYPSIRNRIIFWLSWSLGLKGFLHWGYNSWKSWQGVPVDIPVSPWLDATGASIYCADRNPLPSGDTHVVYPGKTSICSSLRWEVIRKGFEDYEYLYLLEQAVASGGAKKNPRALAAAKRLLKRVKTEVAPDPLAHTRDDRLLLAAREEAGRLLAMLAADT
jgi:hypothetical protein